MTQRGVYAPLVVVEYRIGGNNISGPGLIDSGADAILIPWEIVVALGVDPATWPAEPSSGASGDFEVRLGQVEVRWRGVLLATDVAVAPPNTVEHSLIGRDPFFVLHVVLFNWHKDPPEFHIDPATKQKASR